MIIFGTRTKVLTNKSQSAVGDCDYCGTAQSLFAYRQIKYFHIFWIPIFPYSAQIIMICNHCKKLSYQSEIKPQTLQSLSSRTIRKTPIGYFTGLMLIGLLVAAIVIAGISGAKKKEKYLKDTKVGDLYEVSYPKDGKTMRTLYPIANLTADSVTFDVNDYEADSRKGLRKLKEQDADCYAEQRKLSRSEVEEMKRRISNIERF
ncbi:zinc-ribbon domain-containing protein [Sphingobacterium sp.]|uniref:zinc-ribbon domain-containing protein n=1 Tax=Sphingobacterium sp. TaxID=341027 RepID=UPI002898805A|nr:zinc-ribbon domain-containing protein [Sphingobacterium sp.]